MILPTAAILGWALFMGKLMWDEKNNMDLRVLVDVEEVFTGLDLPMLVDAYAEKELTFIFSCSKHKESWVAVSKPVYLNVNKRDVAKDGPRSMHIATETPTDWWGKQFTEKDLLYHFTPVLLASLDLKLKMNWYGRYYISAEGDIHLGGLPRSESGLRRWIWRSGGNWEVMSIYFIFFGLDFMVSWRGAIILVVLVILCIRLCR